MNPKDWEPWSSRQRMSPFPNYLSMEAVCGSMRRFVGVHLRELLIFFVGNTMTMPRPREDARRVGEFLLRRVQQRPKMFDQLVAKQHAFGRKLVAYARQAGRLARQATDRRTLYRLYAGYEPRYKPVYATYGPVWSIEDYLQREIMTVIRAQAGDDAQRAADLYDSLTKQPSAMVARQERRALLQLAAAVVAKKSWRAALQQREIEGELAQRIQVHVNAYFWVTRDYEDPALSFADIVRRLRELLKMNVAAQLKALTQAEEGEAARRTRSLHQYRFSPTERQLFTSMRAAAHLKELRKRYVSASLHYFDPVLEAVAKQLGLTVRQVRFMRTKDAAAALLRGKSLGSELDARIAMSAWHMSAGKGTEVITGAKAKALFDACYAGDRTAKEFKGMAASPGKARGPARIVMNPDECDKVQKGDIIVSIQVVPSFSTAIMKAAGLVCDGGHGITSHPATLAREAGIPCVIQTKHVREVIKDGDILEVDGTAGVVRKLS